MRCPKCQHAETRVIDSREVREGAAVRRRRSCPKCSVRFTTYEELDRSQIQVVKRDGRREDFNPDKLRQGLLHACSKRPVSSLQIDAIIGEIASQIAARPEREVASVEVGKIALGQLRKLDEVAYLRFVSIFRRYRDASQFLSEIENLIRD